MDGILIRIMNRLRQRDGMEMVQVAILIAIAIILGLVFREKIGKFVNKVFGDLLESGF